MKSLSVFCETPKAQQHDVAEPPLSERYISSVLLMLERAHTKLDELGYPRAIRREPAERTTW